MQYTSAIHTAAAETPSRSVCVATWRNTVCTILAVVMTGAVGLVVIWLLSRAFKFDFFKAVVAFGRGIVYIAGIIGLIIIISLSADLASADSDYTSDFFDPFYAANSTSWGMLRSLTNAYEGTIGANIFWGLCISCPFLASWIKTKSVAIPSIVFLISGGVLMPLLPAAFDAPIRIMFALGIVGLLFHVFIKRR